MARLGKKRISRRTVEALKVEKDTIFWDSELAGFGVRVHPTGRKVYIAQTRADGNAAKRVTVGRHGVITADEARRRAALIVSRIKAGEEAIPEPMAAQPAGGPTVGELAERYLEKHVAVRCKPTTESMYRKRCERTTYPIVKECGFLTLWPRRVSRCRILSEATAPIGIGRTRRPLSRARTRKHPLSCGRGSAGAPMRRRGSCARASGLGNG